MDYESKITEHLDVIERCSILTNGRRALLAGLPDARYPYVYPRDVWAAVRLLSEVALSDLLLSDRAFTLLREVVAFIAYVQREDGHWGQRYEVSGEDKSIYRQEDNVAYAGSALATYLLTANALGREVPNWEDLPRSRVLLDTRLIHDSWRKGCRDERTKARGGFGGGRPQGERSQGPRASQ